MSAYHFTSEHIVTFDDGREVTLTLDVDYTVSRGYPATRIDPEELPEAEVTRAILTGEDGKRVDAQWLLDYWMPSQETLLAEAGEQAESWAADAADYRRDFLRDAA